MPKLIHQPHDKLFKLTTSNLSVAKEFLKIHLPALFLQKMDLTTLRLEKESFVDEAYKANSADVVYSVQLENHPTYIYILCEQQTVVDDNMAFRLLVYTVRLIENYIRQYPHQPLPFVYPIVVYSGHAVWNAPLEIFSLFGTHEELARQFLFKPYQLIDIQRMDDDVLKQHDLWGLVEFVLKYREIRDLDTFLRTLFYWMDKIEKQDQSVGEFLSRVVLKYLMNGAPAEDTDLFTRLASICLTGKLRDEAMTLAQAFERRGIEKGIEEGIQKGMQQGMQEGEAALITRQIQRRFGDIPATYMQRIKEADAQTLLVWGDRILDAATLEEIFE